MNSPDAMDQIRAALANGPMTMAEIASASKITEARVYSWVLRAYRNGIVGKYPPSGGVKGGQAWRYYLQEQS